MKTTEHSRLMSFPTQHATFSIVQRILCLSWLALLIVSGSSPLFYLSGHSNNPDSSQRPSLLVTASAEDALAARLKSLAQATQDGGMGSSPISGSVNLWLLAGQPTMADGASGNRRFGQLAGIHTPRTISNGLGSVSRQIALAGAEKRLEFTLLALKPSGVS